MYLTRKTVLTRSETKRYKLKVYTPRNHPFLKVKYGWRTLYNEQIYIWSDGPNAKPWAPLVHIDISEKDKPLFKLIRPLLFELALNNFTSHDFKVLHENNVDTIQVRVVHKRWK